MVPTAHPGRRSLRTTTSRSTTVLRSSEFMFSPPRIWPVRLYLSTARAMPYFARKALARKSFRMSRLRLRGGIYQGDGDVENLTFLHDTHSLHTAGRRNLWARHIWLKRV